MGNAESHDACTGCLRRLEGDTGDNASQPSGYNRPHSNSRDCNAVGRSHTLGHYVIEADIDVKEDYDLERPPLGHGSFGAVFRATEKVSGLIRAVKSITQSSIPDIAVFQNEVQLMARLSHPGIIKILGSYRDDANLYVVMELCDGGDLFDAISEAETFTEKTAAVIMKQILAAVRYLHEQCIVHRDLKPENFMFLDNIKTIPIEENVLKIIDFGLSCEIRPGESLSAKCGTPFYVAPEVLKGKYGHKVDEWSCGVIMYVFLVGYPPFNAPSEQDVLDLVKNGQFEYDEEDWVGISEDAKDLINGLLMVDPDERTSAEQAVGHTWVRDLAPAAEHVCLQSNIVDQLRDFRSAHKLKKAALEVIARQWNDAKINSLRSTFMALDTNGDGTLDIDELRRGITEIGTDQLPNDIEDILSSLDQDGSGSIDYNEFLASTLDRKEYLEEDICKAAFRVFDVTGNGRISVDELKMVLANPILDNNVDYEDMLKEVDENGDGEIDFDEFMKMMRTTGATKSSKFATKAGKDSPPKAFAEGNAKAAPPQRVQDDGAPTTMLTPRIVKATT